jgi:hypothetical protein
MVPMAHMGGLYTKYWSEKLKGTDHFGGLCVDSRILLKRIFQKEVVRMWTRFI